MRILRLSSPLVLCLVASGVVGACSGEDGAGVDPQGEALGPQGGNSNPGGAGGSAQAPTGGDGMPGGAPAGGSPGQPAPGGAAAGGESAGGGTGGGGGAPPMGGQASDGGASSEGGAANGGAAPNDPGFQSDPGDEGDGTFEQGGPYPLAPEASGPQNGAPRGELSGGMNFKSPTVFSDWWFDYRIYVPAQYEAGKPAALFVIQDGVGPYQNGMKATTVMDNLIHSGEMPVTIGVFIEPGTKKGANSQAADNERSECYDTVSDRYGKFLLEEFLPSEILSKYDIVEDPDGWSIGGSSSGGSAAFIAGWYFPDRFRKISTNIGSFTAIAPGKTGKDMGADVFPKWIRENDAKPLRVNLRSGTRDLRNNFGNWLEANTEMAAALKEKEYHHRFVHGTAGHNTDHAKADFPNELRWLWRGFSLPHYQP